MTGRPTGLRWLALAASAALHGAVLGAGYVLMEVGVPPAADGFSVEIIADLGGIEGPKTAPIVERDEADEASGQADPQPEKAPPEQRAATAEPVRPRDAPPAPAPDNSTSPTNETAAIDVDPVPVDPTVDMVLPAAPPPPPKARPARPVAEERVPAPPVTAPTEAGEAPVEALSAADEGPASDATPAVAPAGAVAAGTAAAAMAGNPLPPYPKRDRRRGIEGLVLLKVTVSPEGFAQSVRVEESSGHRSLDDAARETVGTWRFHPARRLGRPVQSDLLVPIRFRLER